MLQQSHCNRIVYPRLGPFAGCKSVPSLARVITVGRHRPLPGLQECDYQEISVRVTQAPEVAVMRTSLQLLPRTAVQNVVADQNVWETLAIIACPVCQMWGADRET